MWFLAIFLKKKLFISEMTQNGEKSFPTKVSKICLATFAGTVFRHFESFLRKIAFFQKYGQKSHFSLKLPPFWVTKSKKLKIKKNSRWKKFYLWWNFIFTNFWINLTIFEEEDRFFAFFHFLVKNATFFNFDPVWGQKNKFLKKSNFLQNFVV